jgi:hypothetical protein
MKYPNILEEELKNKVAKDYFGAFDCTEIKGKVDFCVALKNKRENQERLDIESILWAEAKKGKSDLIKSIVQLVLTIGKARTFDKHLPPAFLGAFDAEKIAFIPYNEILDILSLNDFNWNVTASNYETREFKLLNQKIESLFENNSLTFLFGDDDKEIKEFVKANFVLGKSGTSKIRVDKNNFIVIFDKWSKIVQPTISFNWEAAKGKGIIGGDFYLADLLSKDNITLSRNLHVVLQETSYEMNKHKDVYGAFTSSTIEFNDGRKAYDKFWNKYERPPDEEYWDYIINRHDLLVPQDIRERKGSFFTPQMWVELSQIYLTETFGENWQEEYYVWDCAAGTGNLLTGLTNKYNVWASTLDKQDVDIMHERIKNGANLLDEHVFQFDFLNDEFTKLPKALQEIINNSEKRRKLIIYINPPYAEATTAKTVTGTGKNKEGVATDNAISESYKTKIGNASNEIFALFMAKIYDKYTDSKLVQFSTLKFIQGTNFRKFKEFFLAKYLGGFVVPANTFDNVKGHFPISLTMWDLSIKEKIENISCDVFDKNGDLLDKKTFYGDLPESINKWIKLFDDKTNSGIGFMGNPSPDFQHNSQMYISVNKGTEHFNFWNFTKRNLMVGAIYFSVRQVFDATWLNNRDQFLYPGDEWEKDDEFQNNCLAYTLFHGQNKITSGENINHWIPFSEAEIDSKEKFSSNFMSRFIQGKLEQDAKADLFGEKQERTTPLEFSFEAKEVFDAGRNLWKYYHKQLNCNVNASLYEIREHFQGRNEAGKMNNKSNDKIYTALIFDLRDNLKKLSTKIEPKVYEYAFLKK